MVQIILFHFIYHLSRFVWQDEGGVGWVKNIKSKVAQGIVAHLYCSPYERVTFLTTIQRLVTW